jgi:hypothetical protein
LEDDEMELLEVLESMRAGDASNAALFGDAGTSVRMAGEKYQAKLVEAAKLLEDVLQGRKPMYYLKEAMTTSDFPYLFGDILDRQLMANYREWAVSWPNYCARKVVSDFRTVKRFWTTGGEAVLTEVAQGTEYPAAAITDQSPFSYAVKKYGKRLPFTWEAMINDDLGALQDMPARLGRAARRSEEKFATQLHVDATGPHASVYTGGNANVVTSNPALSISALQTAMTILGNMVDQESEPIVVETVVLEVPPALEVVANNILNAVQLWLDTNASAGTAQQNLVTVNWMRNRMRLTVNPYIPIVASSSNGNTSWFLHAGGDYAPFEMGFLRGHESPEIFIKAPNATRVGGGAINPLDGDFDTDSIEYKVRHVFGGVALNPKWTVGSNGSG